jgi:hypothetical protein
MVKKGCGKGVGWGRNGGMIKDEVWKRGWIVKEWGNGKRMGVEEG